MIAALISSALLALTAQPTPDQPPRVSGPPGGPPGPMAGLHAEDMEAMRTYDLTERNVKHALALHQKMKQVPEEKRRKLREAAAPGTSSGLEEAAKKMEAQPELARMLESESLSARDFLLTSITMTQATMFARMSANHPGAGVPPMINVKNVEFAQKHPELARSWGQMMQEMRRMRPGAPGGGQGGPGQGEPPEHE